MTHKFNPFATSYPSSRGPLGKIFRPAVDPRTYLRAGHMLLMFPLGIAYFVFFAVTLSVGGSLIWTLLGPVILIEVLFVSRWLGDLEAFTAAYVNGTPIRRPPSRLEGVSNFRSQVKVRLVDPTTWTGLLYLVVQFPVGIAAFVILVVVYALAWMMIFAPLTALFTDGPIEISGDGAWLVTFNTPFAALLITPFGLLVFVLASHMVIAFSSIHGWWARLMLGSRSARVSSRPTPATGAPIGGGSLPFTTPEPEMATPGPDTVLGPGSEQNPDPAAAVRPGPSSPASINPVRALLTPVPNRSEVMSGAVSSGAGAIRELTAREQEVFMLMARGDTNADIAEELFISEGTVKTHVKRILSKLRMRDRTQVVVFAYEMKIVVPGSDATAHVTPEHRSYGG